MSEFNEIFKERYKKLNSSQKEAVDNIEGPVMVIAGPGTGKTTVLVMRIASILYHTDTAPENILALTFTESGVISMQRSLAKIIGPDANRVKIYTFHSFCNFLINEFPEKFPSITGATHISESGQVEIIEAILSDGSFKYLVPVGSPFHNVKNLLGAINTLKREGLEPDDLEKAVIEEEEILKASDDLYHTKGKYAGEMKGKYLRSFNDIEKNKELVHVFKEYQRYLRDRHNYDYNDMILEVVKKMENDKEFSMMVQEENHYLLADEHQDANQAQNRVIKEISSFHEDPNLFIVGDEKQAIFRFQGASFDNFMYFKNIYPNIKLIHLTDNYRSQQTILDVSQELIESGELFKKGVHQPLKASSGHEKEPLLIMDCKSRWGESLAIARKIKDLIEEGVPLDEIAVIYREHKDSKDLAKGLEKMEIPFITRSNKDLFEDPLIKKTMTLMAAACDPLDNEKLFQALYLGFADLDPLDVLRISKYASLVRKDLSWVLEDKKNIEAAGVSDISSVVEVFDIVKEWVAGSRELGGLMPLLEKLIYRSRVFNDAFGSSQSAIAVSRLKDLFKEAERFAEDNKNATLASFLDHLQTMESYSLPLKASEVEFTGRVELLTAHASKGREFDHVFIVNAANKKWGNRRRGVYFHLPSRFSAIENIGDDEDERRLFYVALTRARKKVFISYPELREDGKEQLPSIFLADLESEENVCHQDVKNEEEQVKENTLFIKPSLPSGLSLKEKEYIQETFLSQTLSVTALNSYLECPWKYFYENLIRVPGTYTLVQRFGTAVHEALKDFFDIYREGGDPDKELLLTSFYRSLSRQPLTENDEQLLKEKGEKALSGYYDHYRGSWRRDIVTERSVRDVSLEFDFLPKPIILSGKIDKIEGERDLVVIDYKTGTPKSRNVIEGKTQNSDGAIKRQLIFYKLLIDHSREIEGTMSEGVIDFIEPNKSGKYKKESFSVTEKEVNELKDTIAGMARDVYDLSFLEKGCDDPKCEYCKMRTIFKTKEL
ncbi:MAG: ATP-dependent DNA helicase [Candidatus Paceibacterota bacterium]